MEADKEIQMSHPNDNNANIKNKKHLTKKEKKLLAANTPHIQHLDAFHRMNFLLQAASLSQTATTSNPHLSRHYTKTLKKISQKLVLRIHPFIKRTICKICCNLLIPNGNDKKNGIGGSYWIEGEGENVLKIKCNWCGYLKIIPTNQKKVDPFPNCEPVQEGINGGEAEKV